VGVFSRIFHWSQPLVKKSQLIGAKHPLGTGWDGSGTFHSVHILTTKWRTKVWGCHGLARVVSRVGHQKRPVFIVLSRCHGSGPPPKGPVQGPRFRRRREASPTSKTDCDKAARQHRPARERGRYDLRRYTLLNHAFESRISG
jgi:hypothetical protein